MAKLIALFCLSFISVFLQASVHVYWTPSTTDIEGNFIEPDLVLYHIWIWLDSERGFIDYAQTSELEFQVDAAQTEQEMGACYPLYVTAERVDVNLQSDPSGTVNLCYDGDGEPYDGDNPPIPDDPDDPVNEFEPSAPTIAIEVMNE